MNIPVDFMAPRPEDFRTFSEIMKASAGKKVFVHCQANLRQTLADHHKKAELY